MAKTIAPPIGPAHGSQPGAQAGRHALDGQEMVMGSSSQRVNPRSGVIQNQRFRRLFRAHLRSDEQARQKTRGKSSKTSWKMGAEWRFFQGQRDKAFLIAKPMRKACWTKRFAA
jgi:hypothetical protein